MSPAPIPEHQRISIQIVVYLHQFVERAGLGCIFAEPTDIELSPGTIVKPDVFVLLNEHMDRITRTHIVGAPDLVVEILSPGTWRHDLHEKFDAYARAQVPEYWIVGPSERVIEVFVLENGDYRLLGAFQGDDILPSQVVPGWSVPVKLLFAFL